MKTLLRAESVFIITKKQKKAKKNKKAT